ncbi:MAG TPA: hypothetical protein VM695_03505, partial [Phycisphaerae bacterium]|nr:hypothetical protein [Phycisphaerae bacterium]
MKARYLFAILLAAAPLSGCSWVRQVWPWGRDEDVPVTRPLEDPNAVGPMPVVASAPTEAMVPAPSPAPPVPTPSPMPTPAPAPAPAAMPVVVPVETV